MRLLIVVDMQNDFIDGALGSWDALAIVPKVQDKVQSYANAGVPILYTRDTHFADTYMNTQEGRKLPVPHCIYGSDGHMIRHEVWVPGQYFTDKETFGLADINEVVLSIEEDQNVVFDTIELVGLCTDICVISNAMLLKAFFPEKTIVVDGSCCAGVTPESHQTALKAMQACQIEVI